MSRNKTVQELKDLIRDEVNIHGYFSSKEDSGIRLHIQPVELEMEYEKRGWEVPRDLVLERFVEKYNV